MRSMGWYLATLVVWAAVAEPELSSAQNQSIGGMQMSEPASAETSSPNWGSGTSWEPASVPAHEWMLMRGGWNLMAHGVVFAGYNQQGGRRARARPNR